MKGMDYVVKVAWTISLQSQQNVFSPEKAATLTKSTTTENQVPSKNNWDVQKCCGFDTKSIAAMIERTICTVVSEKKRNFVRESLLERYIYLRFT